MADITWSWPRLRCPALARRQPPPWGLKTSPTLNLPRPTAPRPGAAARAFDPPNAQQLAQLGGQHGGAVFASLARLDPQQHALGVDVADLERDHLGDAQPGPVSGSECRLVLGSRRRLQQKRNLLDAQNGR